MGDNGIGTKFKLCTKQSYLMISTSVFPANITCTVIEQAKQHTHNVK
jgi:hypothetical protein